MGLISVNFLKFLAKVAQKNGFHIRKRFRFPNFIKHIFEVTISKIETF